MMPVEQGIDPKNTPPHIIMAVLAIIGMLSSLAWKVYIGERHTTLEWCAVSLLSLFFSAGVSYLIYPNFPAEYGKLILTSIVAGAGTTVYLGVMIKIGRAGVAHLRGIIIQIANEEENDR